MHRQSLLRLARQTGAFPLVELPPPYLAPSLHFSLHRSPNQASNFSSTAVAAGHGRDLSKSRGVSAIHRTGPKFKLGVSKYQLPKPVARGEVAKRHPTPDHGLWAFFPKDRQALSSPEYDVAHGRSWSIQELREKSWDDLHALWWVCVKERNRIATSNLERERLKAGYGEYEATERERIVRRTQNGIKHVLRERWYAWEDAQKLYKDGYRPQYDGTPVASELETASGEPEKPGKA
ncbi:mitochondrial 54S ribosomal protein uL29m [Aspergillus saccharolyticus JOP 1030-1]|uniref:Large ribosomal subunit protein uL29m n=1 Tax=Aspergillus saccharolyticus JOP 1030-1 TaxID=1450539 RepID=A0A318ZMN3_9EURO|nr:MRP-L47-domain-containing protein [Aspergillus saccharolyticus JOP 1030-1]PYH45150.1 MRP-L47-domain-containing protein [Aspergillus saccharolyticus JOP 1030-1]